MGLAVPATMLAKPVCKHGDSIYQPGRRSSALTKVVSSLTTEAVIVGAVPGNGANTTTFGRLVLTAHTPAGVCAVLAGSGPASSRRIRAALDRVRRETSPLDDPPPTSVALTAWGFELVFVDIEYREISGDGLLRHPRFGWGLRLTVDR
ncbi:ATP dependent DNA ligase [Nocardia salmonicida]|uniref:ATP dependent DNA ligase n=1 Tax=Nocardia salmonicida TaxID=53431 RepID=UPI0037A357AE